MKRYDFRADHGRIDMHINEDDGDWVRFDDVRELRAYAGQLEADARSVVRAYNSRKDATLYMAVVDLCATLDKGSNAAVAQSVEHLASTQDVAGSSPAGRSICHETGKKHLAYCNAHPDSPLGQGICICLRHQSGRDPREAVRELLLDAQSLLDCKTYELAKDAVAGALMKVNEALRHQVGREVLDLAVPISTDVRMPDDGQECMFLSKGGYWHAGRYLGTARFGRPANTFVGVGLSYCASTVTHWMPVPDDLQSVACNKQSEPDPLGEALNSGDGSYKP